MRKIIPKIEYFEIETIDDIVERDNDYEMIKTNYFIAKYSFFDNNYSEIYRLNFNEDMRDKFNEYSEKELNELKIFLLEDLFEDIEKPISFNDLKAYYLVKKVDYVRMKENGKNTNTTRIL